MVAAASIRSELTNTCDAADRALLLEELSHALDAAGEHADRVITLRERTTLSALCGDSVNTKQALACDLAEASLSNHDPEPLHAPELQRLLRSGALDARRTLRACRALIIIAHNMLDVDLAREVFDRASALAPTDDACAQRRAQIQLIYHTIFGDCDQAVAIADNLRMQAVEAPLSSFSARVLMNITLARWVADAAPLSLADLYRTCEQLRAAGMDSYALFCSSRIAFLLHEDCKWDEALHWSTIARNLDDTLSHDRRPMDFLALQMNVALHQGDVAAARRWLDLMPRASPRLATGLNESALQLYGLKFKLLGEQQPADDVDLRLLLSWHQRARSFGRHDEHVAVLSLALSSVGRSQEAVDRIHEYLAKHRRERRRLSPLHAELIHSATGVRIKSEPLVANETRTTAR
jgi:hypothetical protein